MEKSERQGEGRKDTTEWQTEKWLELTGVRVRQRRIPVIRTQLLQSGHDRERGTIVERKRVRSSDFLLQDTGIRRSGFQRKLSCEESSCSTDGHTEDHGLCMRESSLKGSQRE